MPHITMKDAELSVRSGTLSKRTYFDELPGESVENILRFLSESPRRMDCTTRLDPHDVQTIFETGGSLSNVCKSIFSSISTALSSEKFGAKGEPKPYVNENRFLCLSSSSSALYSVLAASAPSIRWICFSGTGGTSSWINNFASRCTSLKNLTLTDVNVAPIFDDILAKSGSRLEYLCASGSKNESVLSIARHCDRLEVLVLTDGDKNFRPIWRATGASLKEVEIKKGLHNALEVLSFGLHCRQIENLDLGPVASNCEAHIAEVYASYGAQLKFAYLRFMSLELCHIVGNACPNVRITWKSSGCTDAIGYFGNRLDDLTIRLDTRRAAEKNYIQNMNQCNALTKLYLVGLSQKYMAVLFASPKPSLTLLYLDVGGFVAEDIWKIVAQSTGALQTLCVTGILPNLNGFRQILTANRMLKRLHVVPAAGYLPLTTALKLVLDIISLIPALPDLQMLFVYSRCGSTYGLKNNQVIRRACSALRFRRVAMSFFGTEYLH